MEKEPNLCSLVSIVPTGNTGNSDMCYIATLPELCLENSLLEGPELCYEPANIQSCHVQQCSCRQQRLLLGQ